MNFNQDLFDLARAQGISLKRIGDRLYPENYRKIYHQGELSPRELRVRQQIMDIIKTLAEEQ